MTGNEATLRAERESRIHLRRIAPTQQEYGAFSRRQCGDQAVDIKRAFAEKGVMSDYFKGVPVWLVTAEYPGLMGAGVALQQAFGEERAIEL